MPTTLESTSISNRVNNPGQNGLPAVGDSAAGLLMLPTLWGNVDFSYVLRVNLINSATMLPVTVTSIECVSAPIFLDALSVGDSLRISKKTDVDIFNESYSYVTFDKNVAGTKVAINPSLRTDDMSIIEWDTADTKFVMGNIVIKVNHSLGSDNFTFSEWFYWNMDIALKTFDVQVARSRW